VAALGAEADNSESFEVIMARLSASKDPRTLQPQDFSDASTGTGEIFSPTSSQLFRSPPRPTFRKQPQPQKLVHPRPFGPARTVGDSFGHRLRLLPNRDLTSWEQQRAVVPERSWGVSAMSSVALLRETIGGSAPSTPLRRKTEYGGDSAGCRPASCGGAMEGVFAAPGSVSGSGLSAVRQRLEREASSNEVLTPVRTMGSSTSWASSSKMPRSPAVHQEAGSKPQKDLPAEEVRTLQEHRLRLASELRRTEQRLREASASDARAMSSTAPSSGDFGATAAVQKPSAGGPFAGRRGVMDRTNAARATNTTASAAATAYNYLGPSADGPPLPEIHPLWS
ncbi:unnamed protein product, partial [Polarella glacialis]